MSRKIFITGVITLAASSFALAQDYVKKMEDPNVNFYEVQQEFENHFKNRPNGKGTGWKQFKRWEYQMEQRFYPSGDRTVVPDISKEMKEYREKHANYFSGKRKAPNSWEELGPKTSTNVTGHWAPGIGRVNAIALDPTNKDVLYIGTPAGGLWKTIDGGDNWIPKTDNLEVLGVSSIAIDPTNTDIIYIATGDGDASDTYSVGVMKSLDGGTTWAKTGLDWSVLDFEKMQKIIINPNNAQELLVGSTRGLYKTSDGGANWTKIEDGNFRDIEFKPGNPSIVYATTTAFYKSTDGGDSFTQISGGLPNSSSRVLIAVTEANPEYVYFFNVSSLYRSTDSGVSFTNRGATSNAGSQAWYDLALTASPLDAEEVHIGELEVHRTFNGGTSWETTTNWLWPPSKGYTHIDIHALEYFGNELYVGSDGMVTKSIDKGTDYINLTEGIGNRQFYRIGVSKSNPYKIVGGSQDNGTSVYSDGVWHEWLGADGGECLIHHTDDNIIYGIEQNGNSWWKSTNGGYNTRIGINRPGGGAWVLPYTMDHSDPDVMIAGLSSGKISKTTDGMSTWTTIGYAGGSTIDQIAIAPSNSDYYYAAAGAKLYVNTSGGSNTTWANISSGLPDKSITSIAVSPLDESIVAVSFSGYVGGEKVYISYDAGQNWVNISGTLPNLPANSLAIHGIAEEGIYVGMDVGIYYKEKDMDDWVPYFDGLPNVPIAEFDLHVGAQKLRAATFGRGLWEIDLFRTGIVLPIAKFKADKTVVCPGTDVSFEDRSLLGPTTWKWSFEGGNPATSTEEDPTVNYAQAGVFDVQLIVVNDNGSDTLLMEDYVVVSSATLPPLTEGFENNFPPLGWSLGNPDNGLTWTQRTDVGLNSTSCAVMNNADNEKIGEPDYLTISPVSFANAASVTFTFDVAYTKYDDASEDILSVEYSIDCGGTWTEVWNKNHVALETFVVVGGTESNNWVPSIQEHWRGEVVDISGLAGESNDVTFRFKNQSGYGTRVWIDNVNISSQLSVEKNEYGIQISPNPGKGYYQLSMNLEFADKVNYRVIDITGKQVLETKLGNITGQINQNIDLTNLANGVYTLEVSVGNQSISKKLIKQ